MVELQENWTLLIVHIVNEGRLNAVETDDYFLIHPDQFALASKLAKDMETNKKYNRVNTIAAVEAYIRQC